MYNPDTCPVVKNFVEIPKMGRTMKTLLLLSLLVLLVPMSAQAVFIDDFTAGAYTLGREGTPMPYTVSATNTDATGIHILGGERVVTLEKRAGSSTQPYIILVAGFGATYNSAFGCEATWTNEYGLNADLNADLTQDGSTAFLVDVTGGDLWSGPRPTPFTVTVISGTGTAATTIQLVDNKKYFIPYTDFPGVDFTDVDYISFAVEQDPAVNDAIDFAIDFFGTNADASVPNETSSFGRVKSLFR